MQPFAVGVEGVTGLLSSLPSPLSPRHCAMAARYVLWVSLASTLFGAALFLGHFAGPGTVVSAGIIMPIISVKSFWVQGWGLGVFWFHFVLFLVVGGEELCFE